MGESGSAALGMTAHPSVDAVKCVDCMHYQQAWHAGSAKVHFCGHPVVPRNLVTGQPTRQCMDMRTDLPPGYSRAPDGLIGCGSQGRLFAAKPGQGQTLPTEGAGHAE